MTTIPPEAELLRERVGADPHGHRATTQRAGDTPERVTGRQRHCYLSTVELHRLDRACRDLWHMAEIYDGGVYLVGSSMQRPDFRDVDVRMMLPDEEFDRMFGREVELWSLFCYAVSRQLADDTDLPIDFQVQRQTQANLLSGSRNPVGLMVRSDGAMHMGRSFAADGDATQFDSEADR